MHACVAALFGFWIISAAVSIQQATLKESLPTKLIASPEDLMLPIDSDWSNERVGLPVGGVSLVIQMLYYQMIILEVMAEMENPKDFPKANKIATGVVVLLYTASAIIYWLGHDPRFYVSYGFRPSSIAAVFPFQDTWFGRLAQFLLGLDLMGSSLVRTVILTRALHLLVHPANANKPGWRPRLEWFGLSAAVVFLGAFLSMAVPHIYILGHFVGAAAIYVCFMLPCQLGVRTFFKQRKSGARKVKITTAECVWMFIVIAGCVAVLITFVISMARQGKFISCELRYMYKTTVKFGKIVVNETENNQERVAAELSELCNITLPAEKFVLTSETLHDMDDYFN